MKKILLGKIVIAFMASMLCTNIGFAHNNSKVYDPKGEAYQPMFGLLANPYWYVGGNVGYSYLHDKSGVVGANVTEDGPGFNANLGYNFLQIYRGTLGGELGYNQYADSVVTFTKTAVARTEHYSAYLAAAAEYPLFWRLGVIGKFGVAYNYARKIFYTTGAANSAGVFSPYGDIGLTLAVNQYADLALQASRSWGNGKTGSADLVTLGVIVNFL